MKNILLIEPNYKNKYPPIGLMKIATYHKILNDKVTFYKGDIKEFILEELSNICIKKLNKIDASRNWVSHKKIIKSYINVKRDNLLLCLNINESKQQLLLKNSLKYYSDYFRNKKFELEPKWDRVYISTLFTFYWDITIKTINDAKILVKDINELKVGGVMASLLPREIENATGIKPIQGLLDRPSILDKDNYYIIDNLPLDYSILDEIDYEYPTGSSYITFMTKGCTRKCAFCSVPKIEPTYKSKIPTIGKFKKIKQLYGEQQNLLLMDNNVLASPRFPEIIEEIKRMGFYKGAKYVEPNQLDIAVFNLRKRINDKAYIKRTYKLLNKHISRLKGEALNSYNNILNKYQLIDSENITKDNLLNAYPLIKDIYEKYRVKARKNRYVDFNQGTDCRYINDEIMKMMSEIPIRPLRIAFDYMGLKKQYITAIELASKYGIKELSNYLLFNFHDSPDELYQRLKINIDLSNRLNIHIFSFPMKYIPLYGEDAKHRNFIGEKWNKKFIRGIQAILNVTKGIVAPGRSFFEKAFGKDLNSYFEILYMPETYIIYRKVFEQAGWTDRWRDDFNKLSNDDLSLAKLLIEKNQFFNTSFSHYGMKIAQLLKHYTYSKDSVEKVDFELKKVRRKYNNLINNNMFINLTLTYDYENPVRDGTHG